MLIWFMGMISDLRAKAKSLKAEIQVLAIAYKDKRTPLKARFLIGLTIGYLLSPIDLIPDFIPVLGLLDDLIIVPLLISWSIRLIPEGALADARAIVSHNPQRLKKNNWAFAAFILAIWLCIIYLSYRLVMRHHR
jgi:uncharacterized membrane protein YkvA (DUF1232 family)